MAAADQFAVAQAVYPPARRSEPTASGALDGVVRAVLFEQGAYKVVRIETSTAGTETICARNGCVADVQPGELLRAAGQWRDGKYGRQLIVDTLERSPPQRTTDIEAFLHSGAVKVRRQLFDPARRALASLAHPGNSLLHRASGRSARGCSCRPSASERSTC